MYFSISQMRKGNPREGDDFLKVAQLVSLCQSWAGNNFYHSMSKLPLQEQSCIIIVYLLWEQGTFSYTELLNIHTSLQNRYYSLFFRERESKSNQQFPDWLGTELELEKARIWFPRSYFSIFQHHSTLHHASRKRLMVVIFSYIPKTEWGWMRFCPKIDMFVYGVIHCFIHYSLCKAQLGVTQDKKNG